jgi:hypothetical protein
MSRNYTIINHEARLALKISITEYCIFDLIHHLATHPKNSKMGWCYAKKETLADYFAVGRMTVFRAIKKGLAAGLLEKHPMQPALLRATRTWDKTVRMTEYQNGTPHPTVIPAPYQFGTGTSTNMRHNNDKDKESDRNTSEAKKNVSTIGAILDQYRLPIKKEIITTEWQAEAIRLWQALGLTGEPSSQFFRHIKNAYHKKQQNKLLIAFSYCQDAKGIRDKEKLFYWRYANEL